MELRQRRGAVTPRGKEGNQDDENAKVGSATGEPSEGPGFFRENHGKTV